MAEELVGRPGVLHRYVEDTVGIHGVVGECPVLKLQTLVAFGAQIASYPDGKPGWPISSSQQSLDGVRTTSAVPRHPLPKRFYLPFESASVKSFFYRAEQDPTILQHVWIYPNETEVTDCL
jgi:hypothetical protein